jgi:type VI secretion system protein ImpB
MGSSQKFIARNRAPRVQIEYDVELYGAEKKVQLPFVMGVMSDLSGKPSEPLPSVADRKFLEIDVDNFDSRLKSMKPRVAFAVPNTLTGEGSLSVDVTFESMDDFSPAAVARKVEGLNKLLEARQQLANLITYMDGKTGAEDLISRVMADPALLATLSAEAKPQE